MKTWKAGDKLKKGRSNAAAESSYPEGKSPLASLSPPSLAFSVSPLQTKPSPVIQRYTVYDAASQGAGASLGWKHPGADDVNVADDGQFAVGESGADAWAETSLIDSAEAKLKAAQSDIELLKGVQTMTGKAPSAGPGGLNQTISKVHVVNRAGGGRADLTADCGTTARQVLGINSSAEKFSGVMKDEKTGTESYTKPEEYRGDPYTTTNAWVEDILNREFGGRPAGAGVAAEAARRAWAVGARAKYDALSPADKDKFDRKYGINKYASPEIGQAITIDHPKGWNFHFAGVILKSGQDYATVENFPRAGRDSQSWYFEIYGPKSKNQTFYDDWAAATGGSTAMVVESEKARKGETTEQTNLTVGFPLGAEIRVLGKENDSWIKVESLSGYTAGKTGWISPNALPPDIDFSIAGQKTKTILATSFVLTALAKGTEVYVMQKMPTQRSVKVTGGTHAGKSGWIKNEHYKIK